MLGCQRASGLRYDVRSRPDEGGATAGDEDLNASKFALLQTEPRGAVAAALDKSLLLNLARLVASATKKLEEYDYASALNDIEKSFWNFCDDYIELVKARRYGDFGPESASSANGALLIALETYLRLFAPYLPFVTEEVVVARRHRPPCRMATS